jgi:hypothetical protein
MTDTTKCGIVNDIIVIMDNSGSMEQMGNEPNEAINSFVEEQKNILSDDATFTLWEFNNNISLKIDDVSLKEIGSIDKLVPNGMTALFDAIGNAINTKLTKPRKDNVICVVITDGLENSSKEFSNFQIKNLIKLVEEKHHWKFVYLGANQDAFAVGENIGIYQNCCLNYETKKGELLQATRAVSENIGVYRNLSSQGTQDLDFALGSINPPALVRQVKDEFNTEQILIDNSPLIPSRQASTILS